MFGILYLFLCFGIGNLVCRLLFPDLLRQTRYTLKGNPSSLPSFFVAVPAWLISGVLPVVWSTYLLAYLFRNQEQALRPANCIVFAVYSVVLILGNIWLYRKRTARQIISLLHPTDASVCSHQSNASICSRQSDASFPSHEPDVSDEVAAEAVSLEDCIRQSLKSVFGSAGLCDWIYLGLVALLTSSLMFATFYFHDGQLWVGATVYSDFAPHLAVIRSFSKGNNFPTVYPHFGGEDIKYHFMFQFLVGNLEFLGLRLDLAFNLPSILSLICVFLLLYALIYRISEKKSVAMMTGFFFAFRSSWALFDFLKEIPAGSIWQTLCQNMEFIGTTEHEEWGLYNLNVYVNQRHLALGMTIMLFVVYQMIGYFYDALERNGTEYGAGHCFKNGLAAIKASLFTAEGWKMQSPVTAAALGLLLGMAGFFHGSCVIACLLILFVLAAASDHRLDFVLIAGISVFLVLLQSRFFTDGSVMSVTWFFGFLAGNKTIFGVMDFLSTLLGVLVILILCVLALGTFELRWLVLAFSAPLIFAFTISMTPDITVNHKYIMISTMLLSSFAAMCIDWLWNRDRKKGIRVLCLALVGLMTCTGIYECYLVFRKNIGHSYYVDDKNSAAIWVTEHASSHDLFLTHWDTVNFVLLGGASLYMGWPYFAWSAGYDTEARRDNIIQIYGAQSREVLTQTVSEQHIDYIVIDQIVQSAEDYTVNEELIAGTYRCVYSDDAVQIYDVSQPVN